MSTKKYTFLDLSGYVFTGKQAVIELVREFKGYLVPNAEFEFNLLRIQGGILDLENALVTQWSPIRSDAAIRRFRKLVRRMKSRNRLFKPQTWFDAIGSDYNGYFQGQFASLSHRYTSQLIQASWRADWPYPLTEISDLELFWRKLKKVLGIKEALFFEMYLSQPTDFLDLTRSYLSDLLSTNANEDTKTIVMHNAFEPFNPQSSLKYFDSAKCIIIDRDPRDNFIAQLPHSHLAVSASVFVERYRLYRAMAQKSNDQDHGDILRINFENLVTQYEETRRKILSFLNEDLSIHIHPKKYFDPALSIKNIGIWKSHPRQKDIKLIHRELKTYCHEAAD